MLSRVLVVASVAWLGALLLAPMAIASNGYVTSAGAAGLYSAGARICHQRPERCFWIHGRPMPVCARCTGLYAGAAVAGPLTLLLASRLSTRRARTLATVAAVPTLVTWGTEMAGLIHPTNAVRFAAALPLGFVAAWLVVSTLSPGARTTHKDP